MTGRLPPGVRQSDIDAHHSGEAQGYEPPEVYVECEACCGEGSVEVACWSYAPGCGFPHP